MPLLPILILQCLFYMVTAPLQSSHILEALVRMTKHLHTLHYAEHDDWSDPIPSGKDCQWTVVLIKHLMIE